MRQGDGRVPPVDNLEQNVKEQYQNIISGENSMFRLIRDSASLASVAGFVWVVCSAAHLVAA
jgi:hypothetical protein